MARDGGRCSVEVQRADGAYLNCRIRIRCNDDLVYGLSGAGFNNCRREGERSEQKPDFEPLHRRHLWWSVVASGGNRPQVGAAFRLAGTAAITAGSSARACERTR